MKFGFMYHGPEVVRRDDIAGYARQTEACGFDSFWAPEHQALYPGSVVEMAAFKMKFKYKRAHPDPLQVLALAGAVTERITLASFLLLPCHHPVVLAKELATLDVLTGGRVRLCVGVGDLVQEIEVCGADFRTRGRRTDESIDVLRALWTRDDATFNGSFFSFKHLVSNPKPSQPIRIDIGGASPASVQRAGERGDGFYPSVVLTEDDFPTYVNEVKRVAKEARRDPDAIQMSKSAYLGEVTDDTIAVAEDQGVEQLVLMTRVHEYDWVINEIANLAERYGS